MLSFTKMSGAGNDFIVLDNRSGSLAASELARLARLLCPRGSAAGADGILALEESRSADVRMRIFNADGSEAEMCGNGARCLAAFAHARGAAKREMVLETLAGPVSAVVTENAVRIALTPAEKPSCFTAIAFADRTADVYLVNTGVPHAVVAVENLETAPVREWGRALRFHAAFAPAGANADFIERLPEGGIALRTYERGVEDETLACGTGAAASALVAADLWSMASPVRVLTRGGAALLISFRRDAAGRAPELALEGPARFVYEATTEWA